MTASKKSCHYFFDNAYRDPVPSSESPWGTNHRRQTGPLPCLAFRPSRSRSPAGTRAAQPLAGRWSILSISIPATAPPALIDPAPCGLSAPAPQQQRLGQPAWSLCVPLVLRPCTTARGQRLCCGCLVWGCAGLHAPLRCLRYQSAAEGFSLLSAVSLTHFYCFSVILAVKGILRLLHADTNCCL